MKTRVILGVSGASGAVLALECARLLAQIKVEIDLTLSPMAERTLALFAEMNQAPGAVP